MPTPKIFSTASMTTVTASTGVARIWIRLVAYMAQMNNGSRLQVIPGHRILWTVTMMFSPVRIEENPRMKIPSPA